MRILVIALLISLAACSKSEPIAQKIEKKADEPVKQYALTGEISRLDVENKIATIKHQAIGDWMGAMTMDFPVKDAADFAKLAPGKPVQATVFVQGLNYWVGEVK